MYPVRVCCRGAVQLASEQVMAVRVLRLCQDRRPGSSYEPAEVGTND